MLCSHDIISRHDLIPWFACLFVNEEHRGKGLAAQLLQHGLSEANRLRYSGLYLSTDLVGFYERNGWAYLAKGYNVMGKLINIYTCRTYL